DDPRRLAYMVASYVRMTSTDRQGIIQEPNVAAKLRKLNEVLTRELNVLEVGQQIQSQVQSEMGKTQREYVLREQMKAIRRELGEENEQDVEADRLARAIDEAGMTAEAREQATRELERLRQMPPAAAEYGVIRTYLETLISLPWQRGSDDEIDVNRAAGVLDADHYGLEEIKERILDFLAVRELRRRRSPDQDAGRGAILCFVGPPGVGKTSLGRSIARALGRPFVRQSLGGVHDEAEIRGHRRTYIGAMPGRIIQGMKTAKSRQAVFMLDEIDKVGADFRGDPTSALLEVLDPEQNNSFSDHYLELAFDLSQVVFVATANQLGPIPAPLRDRMEVIEIGGYTEDEKLAIAKGFLLPKQSEFHGLEKDQLQVTDAAVLKLIREYTREAGVRNLEREIAALCRKVARKVAEAQDDTVVVESAEAKPKRRKKKAAPLAFVIDAADVPTYLGPEQFSFGLAETSDQVGVATGVAWTPTGGDILSFEVLPLTGKGELRLTGQLGDVMRESAQAAMSYARYRAKELGIEPSYFDDHAIHIHVPEGAVPKDGPSAGITLTTALISAMTGRAVRRDVAMTGEVTLRGRVLPIGGLKEKTMAAHRAGIKTFILPKENAKDIVDLPEKVRQDLQLIPVETMDEVLNIALMPTQRVDVIAS
ncbi:MAG TPA: endopeptidase La, partial [Herpetosiphonaceae bacterium]|nr:endopeptidase La [Herpetosiphonaceae bacterium]